MSENPKPTGPYVERNWIMLRRHLKLLAISVLAVPPLIILGHPWIAFLFPPFVLGTFELYCRVQKERAIYHTQGQLTTVREGSEWSAEKLWDYFLPWTLRRFGQWFLQQFTHGKKAIGGHAGRVDRNASQSLRTRHRHFRGNREAAILASMKRVRIGSQPGGPFLDATAYRQSGMAIPSITRQATEAMARGTAGLCMIGTGEGGLWDEHLAGGEGSQVEQQIGTGNYGARNPDGTFNLDLHAATMSHPNVVATCVKLSQGAKQDGGKAPGWKVDEEVAKRRGIPVGLDCFSPDMNPSIGNIPGLVRFVRDIRNRTGKVVGVKMAIGSFAEFDDLCAAWAASPDGMPDYVQIDGGEGGTGAAFEEIMKCSALDASTVIQVADLLLRKHGLRERIKIVGSAGGFSPEDLVRMYALGADIVASGRAFKYMVGCIGAKKCHIGREPSAFEGLTNLVRRERGLPPLGPRGECPTGVAGNGEVIDPVERGRWVRVAVEAMYERTAHLLLGTSVTSQHDFVGTRLKHVELIDVHIWTLREVENIIAVERADWTLDSPAIPESERSA